MLSTQTIKQIQATCTPETILQQCEAVAAGRIAVFVPLHKERALSLRFRKFGHTGVGEQWVDVTEDELRLLNAHLTVLLADDSYALELFEAEGSEMDARRKAGWRITSKGQRIHSCTYVAEDRETLDDVKAYRNEKVKPIIDLIARSHALAALEQPQLTEAENKLIAMYDEHGTKAMAQPSWVFESMSAAWEVARELKARRDKVD